MTPNPNPARITAEMWEFSDSLLSLHPGSLLGGIFANKPGYHNTRNNLISQGLTNDYSIRLNADKQGPGDKAAALDWTFPSAQAGKYQEISKYGKRIQAAFHSRDIRLLGWREALGNVDLDGTAEGFDFNTWSLRSPDSTHAWHWHFSVHRSELNRRSTFLAMLSIIAGQSLDEYQKKGPFMDFGPQDTNAWRQAIRVVAMMSGAERTPATDGSEEVWTTKQLKVLKTTLDEVKVLSSDVKTLSNEIKVLVATPPVPTPVPVPVPTPVEFTLSQEQITQLAEQISVVIVQSPDNTLGEDDMPTLVAASKEALSQYWRERAQDILNDEPSPPTPPTPPA